jgi:hypothetical protein
MHNPIESAVQTLGLLRGGVADFWIVGHDQQFPDSAYLLLR